MVLLIFITLSFYYLLISRYCFSNAKAPWSVYLADHTAQITYQWHLEERNHLKYDDDVYAATFFYRGIYQVYSGEPARVRLELYLNLELVSITATYFTPNLKDNVVTLREVPSFQIKLHIQFTDAGYDANYISCSDGCFTDTIGRQLMERNVSQKDGQVKVNYHLSQTFLIMCSLPARWHEQTGSHSEMKLDFKAVANERIQEEVIGRHTLQEVVLHTGGDNHGSVSLVRVRTRSQLPIELNMLELSLPHIDHTRDCLLEGAAIYEGFRHKWRAAGGQLSGFRNVTSGFDMVRVSPVIRLCHSGFPQDGNGTLDLEFPYLTKTTVSTGDSLIIALYSLHEVHVPTSLVFTVEDAACPGFYVYRGQLDNIGREVTLHEQYSDKRFTRRMEDLAEFDTRIIQNGVQFEYHLVRQSSKVFTQYVVTLAAFAKCVSLTMLPVYQVTPTNHPVNVIIHNYYLGDMESQLHVGYSKFDIRWEGRDMCLNQAGALQRSHGGLPSGGMIRFTLPWYLQRQCLSFIFTYLQQRESVSVAITGPDLAPEVKVFHPHIFTDGTNQTFYFSQSPGETREFYLSHKMGPFVVFRAMGTEFTQRDRTAMFYPAYSTEYFTELTREIQPVNAS